MSFEFCVYLTTHKESNREPYKSNTLNVDHQPTSYHSGRSEIINHYPKKTYIRVPLGPLKIARICLFPSVLTYTHYTLSQFRSMNKTCSPRALPLPGASARLFYIIQRKIETKKYTFGRYLVSLFTALYYIYRPYTFTYTYLSSLNCSVHIIYVYAWRTILVVASSTLLPQIFRLCKTTLMDGRRRTAKLCRHSSIVRRPPKEPLAFACPL